MLKKIGSWGSVMTQRHHDSRYVYIYYVYIYIYLYIYLPGSSKGCWMDDKGCPYTIPWIENRTPWKMLVPFTIKINHSYMVNILYGPVPCIFLRFLQLSWNLNKKHKSEQKNSTSSYGCLTLNGGTPPFHTPKWWFLVGKPMGLLGKPTILRNTHISVVGFPFQTKSLISFWKLTYPIPRHLWKWLS